MLEVAHRPAVDQVLYFDREIGQLQQREVANAKCLSQELAWKEESPPNYGPLVQSEHVLLMAAHHNLAFARNRVVCSRNEKVRLEEREVQVTNPESISSASKEEFYLR